MPVFQAQGWKVYFYSEFRERHAAVRASFDALRAEVTAGTLTPAQFAANRDVKLYEALTKITSDLVPADPQADRFRLGKTLKKIGSNWRRVKHHGLHDRDRLFFRFDSASRSIIFAWLNDENTQRKEGAKTDCYAVFLKMLERKQPPAEFDELLAAVVAEEAQREALARGQAARRA